MVNRLFEGDNSLVPLNYHQLLQLIIRNLRQEADIFKVTRNQQGQPRLIINLDKIAQKIAKANPPNPVLEPHYHVNAASVNFSADCRDSFPQQIREIRDILSQHLETSLAANNLTSTDLLASLPTPITEFQKYPAAIDLSYSFPIYSNLQKHRLSVQTDGKGSQSLLKLHKLTISVENLLDFDQALQTGLNNYIEQLTDNEDELEDLEDILELLRKNYHAKSDMYYLKRLVDKEVLGQLKREALIKYLEYIKENINVSRHPKVIYLHDLIRRLKLIKEYLDNPELPDSHYDISYQGVTVNLRSLFARAESFESLPVIPIVSGYLGETTAQNKSRREFIFSLKMKLNGPVQSFGIDSAFKYHLNLINPETKEHQEELNKNKFDTKQREFFIGKVFKLFFLYYFVFSSRCQPNQPGYDINQELEYDPIDSFDSKFLPILQGDDDRRKQAILTKISDTLLNNKELDIEGKINKLVELITNFIKHGTILQPRNYPVHIVVNKGILENDFQNIWERNSIFKEVVRKKEALQYLSIGKAATNSQSFCQLQANIKIEDIRYTRETEQQQFTMGYDLANINMIPVLLVPAGTSLSGGEYQASFSKRQPLVFPYSHAVSQFKQAEYFFYFFTFFLLAYLCLRVILGTDNKKLFIPIVRFHEKNRQRDKQKEFRDIEKDMASYSKVLSHLLNDEYLSNSQGFNISGKNTYKSLNGMSSLYSAIPKVFRFANPEDTPHLDKLAIIVVSSRVCDSKRNGDRNSRCANLLGEVITINRLVSGEIHLDNYQTFSDNYRMSEMYREPPVILDAVTNLYQQGYRHFLYIAQAPYTSSLNLTLEVEDDRSLFFLSKELISYLYKKHKDMYLYPIFFDQYYVRKLKDRKEQASLYIKDSEDLRSLVADPGQKTVVFFNLFNGISVSPNDTVYNGVISYATLLGIYDNILNEQHLFGNLISDSQTKNDILQYITLFHFSRYEKSNKIDIKLNPYEKIIGDESIGKLSLMPHIQGEGEFNTLAFLSEVKKTLIE